MDELKVINASNAELVLQFTWVCPQCEEVDSNTTPQNQLEIEVSCWNCAEEFIVKLTNE